MDISWYFFGILFFGFIFLFEEFFVYLIVSFLNDVEVVVGGICLFIILFLLINVIFVVEFFVIFMGSFFCFWIFLNFGIFF